MKKISMILVLIALTASAFAQDKPFKGFLLPIEKNPIIVNTVQAYRDLEVVDSTYSIRLFRLDMSLGGVQVLYNKVEKKLNPQPFLKVGLGLTYSFYKVVSGVPINYLSINGVVFLPLTESNQLMSFAFTVSSLRLFKLPISPGIGINFTPSYIKSDYFPLAPLLNLKYNF